MKNSFAMLTFIIPDINQKMCSHYYLLISMQNNFTLTFKFSCINDNLVKSTLVFKVFNLLKISSKILLALLLQINDHSAILTEKN